MFAPAVPTLMEEFHQSSSILAAFVVSIFILGFACGPPFVSPLSEILGRLPIYHTCNVIFFAANLACAWAPSFGSLMFFRFLAGCAGSGALAIGGGTIADVIPIHHRGKAMVLFSIGPILGPVIGPVGGGFTVMAKSWHWIFWIVAILGGAVTILCFIFMKETFAPVLLKRKAERLQKEFGTPADASKSASDKDNTNAAPIIPNGEAIQFRSKYDRGLSTFAYFRRSIYRPFRLLPNPIVLSVSMFLAVQYGYLYLLFTTFTIVFRDVYGFNLGAVGLSYLGIGIGSIIGAGFYAVYCDRIFLWCKKHYQTEAKPEYRVPLMILGAAVVPAGLFIYGWTVQYECHWMAAQVGLAIYGFGMVLVFVRHIPLPP
jgi:multidrug resistance protein